MMQSSGYYLVSDEDENVVVCTSSELIDYINEGFRPISFHEGYTDATSQFFL